MAFHPVFFCSFRFGIPVDWQRGNMFGPEGRGHLKVTRCFFQGRPLFFPFRGCDTGMGISKNVNPIVLATIGKTKRVR